MRFVILLTVLVTLTTANEDIDCNTHLVPRPTFDLTAFQEDYMNQRLATFKQIAASVGNVEAGGTMEGLNTMFKIYTAFRDTFSTKVAYFMYTLPAIHPLAVDLISTYSTLIATCHAMVKASQTAFTSPTDNNIELALATLQAPFDDLAVFRNAITKITDNPDIASKLDDHFTAYLKIVLNAMTQTCDLSTAAIKEMAHSLKAN